MTAREIPGPTDRLTIEAEFGGPPDEVFDHFVRPDLLARWWAPEAEVDPARGAYRLAWPEQGWTLRGRYTLVDRPTRLGFTWHWDHEPDLPVRQVDIAIEPTDDGSRLTVTQSRYGAGEAEQEDRRSHLDGWLHFLDRLAEALKAPA